MARYLGETIGNAIKFPCTAPATSDVLRVDSTDPKVGTWGKVADANIDSTRALLLSSGVTSNKLDFGKAAAQVGLLSGGYIADSAIAAQRLAATMCGKLQILESNAVATFTTTTPTDPLAGSTTAAAYTDGAQLLSQSWAQPESTGTTIVLHFLYLSSNTDSTRQNNLITDATGAAVIAVASQTTAGNLKPEMAVCCGAASFGVTTSRTILSRCGTNAGTSTFNGSGGTVRYTGQTKSVQICFFIT